MFNYSKALSTRKVNICQNPFCYASPYLCCVNHKIVAPVFQAPVAMGCQELQ